MRLFIDMPNLALMCTILGMNIPFLKLLREIFLTFMLSLILSYTVALTLKSITGFLENRGLSQVLSRVLAFLVLVATSLVFIYFLIYRLYPVLRMEAIEAWLRVKDDNARSALSQVISRYSGIDFSDIKALVDRIAAEILGVRNVSFTMTLNIETIANTTGSTIHSTVRGILIIAMSAHLLKEWNGWHGKVLSICSRINLCDNSIEKVTTFMNKFDQGFKGWLLGQLLISIILSVYYCLCFSFIKLKGSVLLAIVCGFTAFIPYLGDIITAIAVALSMALSEKVTTAIILAVILWIIFGHCLGSYALTPVFMKKHAGVSPIQVIIGILLFSRLFGVLGVVLNVPMWVIINSAIEAFLFKSENIKLQNNT